MANVLGAEPSQESESARNDETDALVAPDEFKYTWRIWCVFIALAFLAFMAAIDSTIITTSLPTITREIGGTGVYVWIANSYLFASTVPQPLYAQIANVFGRRNPLFVAIALFFIGSGVAGGAHNPTTLIAGRTIQGLGSGGLYVLSDVIICDLIPPRYRGPFLSAVLSTAAIGTTIGPIIGGALAEANWRWIFWINLPVVSVLFFMIVLALRVKYKRSATWRAALSRVDFLGNAIFIPSIVSLFFGLIMGGNNTAGYPWRSWRVILPLILGVVGWVCFHIYESSSICREPSAPPRLFKHRTSAIGFFMIFLASIVLQGISYFLPIYFQAVKGATPLLSGVYYLPFTVGLIPLAGLAGGFLSKTGKYKPVHWAGFALSATGVGLFSILKENTPTGTWIGIQLVAAAGAGFIFTVTLPSTLAPLSEADVAVATGTYSFVRSLGLVWGATMSAIIFNNQVDAHLGTLSDPSYRPLLAEGAAYTFASGPGMQSLPATIRAEVIHIYVEAMRIVWLVFVGVSSLGFLVTFLEKHVELRTENTSEFGLVGEKTTTGEPEKGRATATETS
ncbi:major facilitator superfamily domain-containing protein [Nemania sp. NC0429]|nr:major facilitator superfamily domain-containing protein [Nemania sp. NC0429]